MFRRSALGLDIHHDELRAVNLGRVDGKAVPWGVRVVKLDSEIICPSFSDTNIKQVEPFRAAVKEVLGPIAGKTRRLAVALPDRAGKVFLLELEKPIKNRREGAELIRWHLREELPKQTTNRVSLDYQVLDVAVSGRTRVLAAVIKETVLTEYEETIRSAGYDLDLINFHTPALFNCHQIQATEDADYILVGLHGHQLGLMIVVNNSLAFLRSRTVNISPGEAVREISRSLAGYRSDRDFLVQTPVILLLDWPALPRLGLQACIADFFGKEAIVANPVGHIVQNKPAEMNIRSMYPAWGVAERLIARNR